MVTKVADTLTPQNSADRCTYQVSWNEDSQIFMGTCLEHTTMSCVDETPAGAFRGIRYLVRNALANKMPARHCKECNGLGTIPEYYNGETYYVSCTECEEK